MLDKFIKITCLFVIISIFILIGEYVLFSSEYFAGLLFDGAFQTFNPLFRLSKGNFFGSDYFFNFHGVGVAFIHYPLFVILGKTLYASEISRNIISIFFFFIGIAVFLHSFIKSRYATLIAFSIVTSVFVSEFLVFKEFILPDVSSKGTRAFIGIILVPIFLFLFKSNFYKKYKDKYIFEILAGVLCGFNIFYSTDTGLASFGAFLVLLMIFPPEHNSFVLRLKGILVFILFVIPSFLIPAFIGCGLNIESLANLLKFIFIFQPNDQIWYFGAPPNDFFPQLDFNSAYKRYFIIGIISRLIISIILFASLVSGYFLHKNYKFFRLFNRKQYSMFIFLMLFGLVSCVSLLGIFAFSYTNLLYVVNLLIVTVIVSKFILINHKKFKYIIKIILALSLTIFLIYKFIFAFVEIKYLETTVLPKDFSSEKFSDVYLHKNLEETHLMFKKHFSEKGLEPKDLWSTYSSLQSPMLNFITPTFDYIIFVLGPVHRKNYAEQFSQLKPKFVTTLNPRHTMYEKWLVTHNWNFYELLYQNYRIIDSSKTHLIWEKITPDKFKTVKMSESKEIKQEKKYIIINEPYKENTVMVINLEYEVKNRISWLPIFGKLPRYLLYEDKKFHQAISLPPYYNEMTFPIFTQGNKPVKLNFLIKPNIFADIKFKNYKIGYMRLDVEIYKKATDFTYETVTYQDTDR